MSKTRNLMESMQNHLNEEVEANKDSINKIDLDKEDAEFDKAFATFLKETKSKKKDDNNYREHGWYSQDVIYRDNSTGTFWWHASDNKGDATIHRKDINNYGLPLEDLINKVNKILDKSMNESEQVKEDSYERYYYGEVQDILKNLSVVNDTLDSIVNQSNNCIGNSKDNQYSDLQRATLIALNDNIEKVKRILSFSNKALTQNFPNRIGTLSKEQKEYIEAHRDELEKEEN